MIDDLKPVKCGCGGEAKIESASGYDPFAEKRIPELWYGVICKKCKIQTKSYYTEAEAVQAWNRAMSGVTDTNVGDKERIAKVETVEKPIIGDTEGKTIKVTSCGNCKNTVSIFDNFCPGCGCRLIWGDDNE